SAHARGKAAVPGIGFFFVRNELPIESFHFYRSVGDRHVGVDGRLAKVEFHFRQVHDYGSPPVPIAERYGGGAPSSYHLFFPAQSRAGKLRPFRIAVSRSHADPCQRRHTMSDLHAVPETPELKALHARLAEYSLGGHWQTRASNPDLVPHMWPWSAIYSCLMESGEVVKLGGIDDAAKRRTVQLVNPALTDRKATSRTLQMSIQLVKPDER